jgi:bacillopeptidase F
VVATSGTLSSAPATYTVRIDTVAPTTTVPTKTLLAPNTLTASTIPVRLAWSGSDSGTGISRYEMQLSLNAGAFTAVSLSSSTATTATVFMSPGNNQVRVRAVDAAGNAGAWSTTAVFNVGVPSETSTSIAYAGTWTTGALSGAFGGSVKSATAAGATAKLTFSGPSAALITTKGPNRGIAQIFIDGSTTPAATVDLYSATQSVRQMVFATNGLSTTLSHTITIRVTGTKNTASTSTRVDVDGFVVLK